MTTLLGIIALAILFVAFAFVRRERTARCASCSSAGEEEKCRECPIARGSGGADE